MITFYFSEVIPYFWYVKKLILPFFLLIQLFANGQEGLYYVKLDTWSRDDIFNKAVNPIAFFFIESDTILSYDAEGLKDPQPIRIKRPDGFKSYAYGYLFFAGVPNPMSNGMINLLLVNVKEKNPRLFIDRNNNFDFNDDGEPVLLPHAYKINDSVVVELKRQDNPNAGIAVQLSRINSQNKANYKNMLNEYYDMFYKGRKFVGIDYCVREQRFVTRSGVLTYGSDSFRVALYDGNSNGLYNDVDADKVITANIQDSVFDSRDELHAFTQSKNKDEMFIEQNGAQFEIVQIDPAGKFIVLKQVNGMVGADKIPAGEKVPKFAFYDWQGHILKIKKYRRKNVFIYFTGPNVKNFSQDTATLRLIADKYKDKVTVIGFIDVNKSYELRIFGTYANLNWIAAFKDKDINRKLKIRGLPSSIWLARKRKVVKYNLTPKEFLTQFENVHVK